MGNTDQYSIFKEILESNLLSSGESLITRLQLPNVAKTIRWEQSRYHDKVTEGEVKNGKGVNIIM